MAEAAIIVEGLGKRYRLGKAQVKPAGAGRVFWQALTSPFRYLIRSATRASEQETLWALREVSFAVQAGEMLGVIGRNGAGKSTLLKVLARITDPSEGRARLFGRVGSLLEVGTGFHPELTGRENIHLNGAILGMRRAEIGQRFDEIVAFAEVERFIDTPVKYYSSGMYVRLAFSVAAHLNPEILLVDEVLAVGDLAFQKKCLTKMGSVAGEGRTILLVSHNMEAILGLCPRAIWIDHGRLAGDGPSEAVVNRYTQASLQMAALADLSLKPRSGRGMVEILGLEVRNARGEATEHAPCGEAFELAIPYRTPDRRPIKEATVWIWLRDHMGRALLYFYNVHSGQQLRNLPAEGRLVCRVDRMRLVPGSYVVDVGFNVAGHESDKVLSLALLQVTPGDFYATGLALQTVGQYLNEHDWRVEA